MADFIDNFTGYRRFEYTRIKSHIQVLPLVFEEIFNPSLWLGLMRGQCATQILYCTLSMYLLAAPGVRAAYYPTQTEAFSSAKYC